MDVKKRTIKDYLTARNQNPFQDWLWSLDGKARGIVRGRLNRVRLGNLGDCEPVGDGAMELRINFGPGYRVYFGEDGDIVVLLGGGNKKTQRADIAIAKQRWSDYNA